MIGKVSREDLERFVFTRTGKKSGSVLVGPAYGEDTAAVRLGEHILVINTDPIIFAADRIGTIGINIASNDVAASGADPLWLTVTYLLPAEDTGVLDRITDQVDRASRKLGISVVGGHSEYVPILNRPFLSLTCFGTAERFIPTGGANPGDRIILTKGAAIEGTGILATDFRKELEGRVPPEVIEEGSSKMEMLSVLPEAVILRKFASAMHDPTEGGIVDGLVEMAAASGVSLRVDRERVPVSADTGELCAAMGVDPMKIFGSGALLAAVPPESADEAAAELADSGIPAEIIGRVERSGKPEVRIGEDLYEEPVRDELYGLWE
jgi:hydrogenase expression/formation protein HypE